MPVERQEYNAGQERIHNRIDEIAKSTAEIETYSKAMKESTDRIFQAIYGNGRDGIIHKVAQMCGKLGMHAKLIIFLIAAIMAIAGYVIQINIGV